MNFNKIRGPCVGADLSCPSPQRSLRSAFQSFGPRKPIRMIMNFNKIRGPCVGADLSCPSPIYRPPETHPHVRIKKLKFVIEHVSRPYAVTGQGTGELLGMNNLCNAS